MGSYDMGEIASAINDCFYRLNKKEALARSAVRQKDVYYNLQASFAAAARDSYGIGGNTSLYSYIGNDIMSLRTKNIKFRNGCLEFRYKFISKTSSPSYYPEGYPNGVDNLMMLLNNGYSAKRCVYKKTESGIKYSLKYRSGARFLERGIRIFNGGWGAMHDCVASLC